MAAMNCASDAKSDGEKHMSVMFSIRKPSDTSTLRSMLPARASRAYDDGATHAAISAITPGFVLVSWVIVRSEELVEKAQLVSNKHITCMHGKCLCGW
jgi:hypothetical protein